MEQNQIARWIAETMNGVVLRRSWNEAAWFYNPGGLFANGASFLTMKEADGPNDRLSHLDRDGVWRLSFGADWRGFEARFGPPPPPPAEGAAIEGPWDFAAIDAPTPHPVFGHMSWVAVNLPSRRTFEALQPLLLGAHARARKTYEKRFRDAERAA